MRTRGCALLSCAAMLIGGCSREARMAVEIRGLAIAAQRARYAESCLKRVVMERSSSFAVAAPKGAGVKFRLFYYGMTPMRGPRPGGALREVYPPGVMAEFDPATGASSCTDFASDVAVEAGKTLGPRMGPGAEKLGLQEYKLKEAELYSALEQSSAAYFAGRKDNAALADTRDFLERFVLLSEPGLLPFYRELNPDFWKWAEDLTGRRL